MDSQRITQKHEEEHGDLIILCEEDEIYGGENSEKNQQEEPHNNTSGNMEQKEAGRGWNWESIYKYAHELADNGAEEIDR
eukprot:4662175-Heterocapsa_arctica.AAC.1